MAIKPILFNTEMSRAIRDGGKTQTRRVCKGQGECNPVQCGYHPPFIPGDILWVRETWYKDAGRYMYRANYTKDDKFYRNGKEVGISWRPSIHMPKEAARTFLLVTNVRCERLQRMDSQDGLAEGIIPKYKGTTICVIDRFIDLWNSTIKPADRDRYGWDGNPWVWVIEFKQCARPDGW